MNYLIKAWGWLLWSSANPDKVSLTLKGFIPLIVLVFGVSPAVQNVFSEDMDVFVELIVKASEVGTGLVGAFGLVRKLAFSFPK